MAAIGSYTATSAVADDDYALLNGTTNGTRRISVGNLASEMQRLAPSFDVASEIDSMTENDYVMVINAGSLFKISFSNLVDAVKNAIDPPEDEPVEPTEPETPEEP